MPAKTVQFFISHAGIDRDWAEWVAWELVKAGYTVELDEWHWLAGENFVSKMNDALARCESVVALFSSAYFERPRYTTDEWTTAALHIPDTDRTRLIPVRIENIPITAIPPLLQKVIVPDIFGMPEEQARRALLKAVDREPRPPATRPAYPGQQPPTTNLSTQASARPKLPSGMPSIWNIPTRSAGFTGREDILLQVRKRFADGRAAVQALHGIGGIGKTQLAVEYAHRFARTYDLAWWISADQPALIAMQFEALGGDLGFDAPTDADRVGAAVLRNLRGRDRWLLVFDGATNQSDLKPWLRGNTGHILITSKEPVWDDFATPLEIDVLSRGESVAILRSRVPRLSEDDANKLAANLGDLPLGIAHAAGFLAVRPMPVTAYLELLKTRGGEVMDEAPPANYSGTLAAAIRLAADNLAQDDGAAAEMANLCAFLAPDPIPQDLFTSAPTELPDLLAARAADQLAWHDTMARLVKHSLARIDQGELQFHQLTQDILRDRLGDAEASRTRARTEAIMAANNPGDPLRREKRAKWASLMPHLLEADLSETPSPALRSMACDACLYLLARGDAAGAYELLSKLYDRWRTRLGEDDPHTSVVADYLMRTFLDLGKFAAARDFADTTLARRLQLRGDDDPETLMAANYLAASLLRLGDAETARDMDRDTLARRHRVLGDDHPDTMTSASNLAVDLSSLPTTDLSSLRNTEEARALDQETLARRRRVLGDDHPDTLASASNLAADLSELDEKEAARGLLEDTLDRRRETQGEDHPDTLKTAAILATNWADVGGPYGLRAARELTENVLNRREEILGADHPDSLIVAINLANIMFDQGEASAAKELAEKTLPGLVRALGPDNRYTRACSDDLAKYRRTLGEQEK